MNRNNSSERVVETDKAVSSGVDTGHGERKMSVEQAERRASLLLEQHQWDPNMPEEKRNSLQDALRNNDIEGAQAIEASLEENSPYPEVRAAVRNYDEDVPANTIRAWVIGMVLCTLGSGVNMLFSMRSPSIYISSIVAQLLAYPIGKAWEKIFPDRQFNIGGLKFNLNPGPFNLKEHVVIVVMSNASYGGGAAYSTDTLLAQIVKYKQNFGWGFQLLYTISLQCMGYGLAGLCRRFLVWPAAMIWPSNLVNTALFYTLHDHSKSDPAVTHGWTISRYKYFGFVFLGSFIWYWFPGYIFQALSVFAFVTFIKPNNVIVNQLFGGWTGISLLPITFDWTQIAGYVGSPLIPPWHALANTTIGVVLFYMICTLAIHYSGGLYSAYLPISDSGSYDNTGNPYNVTKILTPEKELDIDAYHKYSPLFLSTTFSLSYGLSFASISALIVHTYLYHGKEIWYRLKVARDQEDDVHMRLMRKYKDAPDWWYLTGFLLMFGMGMATVLAWDTHLAAWAFILALIIAFLWMIPIGMIQAITNIQIGLNVITEFLIGYMQPGRPLAMMLFKSYGYITMSQALYFVQDLKLGHYMKVPPRVMFWSQVVATIWSGIVQIAVMNWALGAIKDVCTPDAVNHFTCPNAKVFFNASIIWGLIGPARIFSPGQIYSPMLWFFLIGAILPVVFWVLSKKFPRSPIRYINVPVITGGSGLIPPATPLNYLSWGIVGFIFNKYIRGKYFGWWSVYNYITSAALDTGLAISTIVIFFALSLSNTSFPDWWGNTIAVSTMDAQGTAVQKIVAQGETFGPKSW
jgi:OPT family small oligopeptide transporter